MKPSTWIAGRKELLSKSHITLTPTIICAEVWRLSEMFGKTIHPGWTETREGIFLLMPSGQNVKIAAEDLEMSLDAFSDRYLKPLFGWSDCN